MNRKPMCWENSLITAVRPSRRSDRYRMYVPRGSDTYRMLRRADLYACTYGHTTMYGPGVVNFISLLDRNHRNDMLLS